MSYNFRVHAEELQRRLTRRTTQGYRFRTDAKREALAKVHPWSRAPEDREREHVQDGERDERVAAATVARRELVSGCSCLSQGEVSDETGDDGASRFHD